MDANDRNAVKFRNPTTDDGAAIWRVVKNSGVLDLNSAYMYMLLAREFSDTCVVAEHDNSVVGFVTGFRPPQRPESIFLWQVGVDASMRGSGLGKRLLAAFLQSPGAHGATMLETTISPSNEASKALFGAIARELGTDIHPAEGFRSDQFPPEGDHEAEDWYFIGPFDPSAPTQLNP